MYVVRSRIRRNFFNVLSDIRHKPDWNFWNVGAGIRVPLAFSVVFIISFSVRTGMEYFVPACNSPAVYSSNMPRAQSGNCSSVYFGKIIFLFALCARCIHLSRFLTLRRTHIGQGSRYRQVLVCCGFSCNIPAARSCY